MLLHRLVGMNDFGPCGMDDRDGVMNGRGVDQRLMDSSSMMVGHRHGGRMDQWGMMRVDCRGSGVVDAVPASNGQD